jgi:hypothetical protein
MRLLLLLLLLLQLLSPPQPSPLQLLRVRFPRDEHPHLD